MLSSVYKHGFNKCTGNFHRRDGKTPQHGKNWSTSLQKCVNKFHITLELLECLAQGAAPTLENFSGSGH